jgi:hypothetical protein
VNFNSETACGVVFFFVVTHLKYSLIRSAFCLMNYIVHFFCVIGKNYELILI